MRNLSHSSGPSGPTGGESSISNFHLSCSLHSRSFSSSSSKPGERSQRHGSDESENRDGADLGGGGGLSYVVSDGDDGHGGTSEVGIVAGGRGRVLAGRGSTCKTLAKGVCK
jgi:hypothetical protein